MQPEVRKLLWDMRRACKRISRFTAVGILESYTNDDMVRSAVERQFEIIGEALNRLLKSNPKIAENISEYRRIISFRNALN